MPFDPIYLPLHSEIFQPLVCHCSGKYFLSKCESELEQKLGCVSGPRIRGVDRINSSLCFHSEHVLNARFFSNNPKLATSHLLGGRVYCFPFYLPAAFLIFALSICCKNPQKSEILEQITISVCVSLLRTTSIFWARAHESLLTKKKENWNGNSTGVFFPLSFPEISNDAWMKFDSPYREWMAWHSMSEWPDLSFHRSHCNSMECEKQQFVKGLSPAKVVYCLEQFLLTRAERDFGLHARSSKSISLRSVYLPRLRGVSSKHSFSHKKQNFRDLFFRREN